MAQKVPGANSAQVDDKLRMHALLAEIERETIPARLLEVAEELQSILDARATKPKPEDTKA